MDKGIIITVLENGRMNLQPMGYQMDEEGKMFTIQVLCTLAATVAAQNALSHKEVEDDTSWNSRERLDAGNDGLDPVDTAEVGEGTGSQ